MVSFPAVFAKSAFGASLALLISSNGVLAQSNECTCLVDPAVEGVVQTVRGSVFVSQASGSVPALKDMRIATNGSVIVGPNSSSLISFGSGCALQLGENVKLNGSLQGAQQCLAVSSLNEVGAIQSSAPEATLITPGSIAATIGAGALIIGVSTKDVSVSK